MKKSLLRKISEAVRALATREIRIEFERLPISLPNASFRKIINWLLVEFCILLKMKQPWGCPTHLQIEPTTNCNLKCTHCPCSRLDAANTGNLDYQTYVNLIDSIGKYTLLIVLWGWGEPFLNPDIYKMISYARRKNIRLISSTNGHVFCEMTHARRLVMSGLDTLIVSFTGTTQMSFSNIRENGRLDITLRGVRNIIEQKRRLNSRTPFINLSFVVSEHNNADQVSELKELALSLEVDALSIKRMNTRTVKSEGDSGPPVEDESSYRRFRYTEDGPVRVKNNPCKVLWHNPTLRWDGNIHPCIYDIAGEHKLGDLKETPFPKIWVGEHYQKFRRQFRRKWQEIKVCHDCSYAFEGGNYTDVIADTFFFNPEFDHYVPDSDHD